MERKASKGPGFAPVWASIGAALRFAVEHWRFVLMVAIAAAGAHALALAGLGASLLWLLGFVLIATVVHAVLTRAALSGPASVRQYASGDAPRTLAALCIVGLLVVIVFFVLWTAAAAILIAPYVEEAAKLKDDAAATQALMQRAIAAQPNMVAGIGLVGALLIFALTSRFYFAAPASVAQGRVLAFQSWAATRGHSLRIMVARLVLLGPAFILASALQSIAGGLLGVNFQDTSAVLQRAFTDPLFWGVMQALQVAIYGALEAGLSAQLYRQLAPPPQSRN
jgi:hypothetical protein